MLNHHKQTPNIFSACDAPEITLLTELAGPLDLDLDEIFEISDASSSIDEMQIDKLYQYL